MVNRTEMIHNTSTSEWQGQTLVYHNAAESSAGVTKRYQYDAFGSVWRSFWVGSATPPSKDDILFTG
jgi:hypothetical protein